MNIRLLIELVRSLHHFVDKAASYMENNTNKNIMFLKWNILSSGNVTFQEQSYTREAVAKIIYYLWQ